MKDNTLKKIQRALKNYFTYTKDDGIIVVSLDKSELPFAYIVEDVALPKILLISFAVDFPLCNLAANVVLEVNKIKEVVLAENFYISNSGDTFWGTEAERLFELDNFVDLESLEAASEELN